MTTFFALPPIVVPNSAWLTSNGRYHWADKSRRTATLRKLARYTWHGLTLPEEIGWPVLITARIAYPKAGRVDPTNAMPTLKALIDGGTDAGIWPDDDHTHLVGPLPVRDPQKADPKTHRITFTITPQNVPF